MVSIDNAEDDGASKATTAVRSIVIEQEAKTQQRTTTQTATAQSSGIDISIDNEDGDGASKATTAVRSIVIEQEAKTHQRTTTCVLVALIVLLLIMCGVSLGLDSAVYAHGSTVVQAVEDWEALASCSEPDIEAVVPTVQVPRLGDLFREPPDLIAAVQRIGLTLPSDWECQARSGSGAWPCPEGVPSQCRWYNFDLSRFYYLPSWSTTTVLPFLSWAGGNQTGDNQTGGNQHIDDMCRSRPCPPLMACAAIAPCPLPLFACTHPCPNVAALIVVPVWMHTRCANYFCKAITADHFCCDFAEEPQTPYDVMSVGPLLCGDVGDGGLTDFFATEEWGYSSWTTDPNVDVHYISFEVSMQRARSSRPTITPQP